MAGSVAKQSILGKVGERGEAGRPPRHWRPGTQQSPDASSTPWEACEPNSIYFPTVCCRSEGDMSLFAHTDCSVLSHEEAAASCSAACHSDAHAQIGSSTDYGLVFVIVYQVGKQTLSPELDSPPSATSASMWSSTPRLYPERAGTVSFVLSHSHGEPCATPMIANSALCSKRRGGRNLILEDSGL